MCRHGRQPGRHRRGVVPALLALSVVAASACSSGASDAGGTPPRGSDTPAASGANPTTTSPGSTGPGGGTVAPDPTEGCGKPLAPGLHGPGDTDADVAQSISVGGVDRSYRLGVPRPSDNRTPQPLVLNLHGSGSNAVQQSAYSQLPTRGGERGYVVVTPDAIGGQWQLFPTDGSTGTDLAFIKAVLDHVEADLCIDRNRVFATGISLGSAMATDLACTLTDRFAAVGNVAEEVVFPPCDRDLPVIAFHGNADKVVPYKEGDVTAGQANSGLPGTEHNMANWAALAHCDPTPTTTMVGTEVVHSVWPGCAGGAAVELYTIQGGGHTWPGSPVKVDYLGHTSDQIDATALILDFFDAHPLHER